MSNIYGCIGEKLGHSFSKEIHNALTDYEYNIIEIPKDKLDDFMREKSFKAINVTIPYKELVIPHLYEIDAHAKKIGAVNTVVNRDGRLYGYNTDFYGLSELIRHAGIEVKGKSVAILGAGGTSKTALAVASALGAKEVLIVSRRSENGAISYEELYKNHSDIDIIINTTPVGMYPNIDKFPIALEAFTNLSGVIDAIYNPLRTPLVLKAREIGIKAEGGLYMLVAQAVRASEIFLDITYPSDTLDKVYKKILREKENIVLIGMPASGKSTVGKLISEELARTLLDTDSIIEEKTGEKISDIFARYGEKHFRDIESEVAKEIAQKNSSVISCGGGLILRPENVFELRKNGRLFFIDMPLERLIPTSDRPLASDRKKIEERYKERYELYKSIADKIISVKGDAISVKEEILGSF